MVPIAATALSRRDFGDVIFARHLDYGRLQPSVAVPPLCHLPLRVIFIFPSLVLTTVFVESDPNTAAGSVASNTLLYSRKKLAGT